MKVENIHRKDTGLFSEHQVRLSYDQEGLSAYLHRPFSKEAIAEQMKLKSGQFSGEQRNLLVNVLLAQNEKSMAQALRSNIESLGKDSTFTVTTGHQLTLLAGPLYFLLKIIHVVKLAEELSKVNSENHIEYYNDIFVFEKD